MRHWIGRIPSVIFLVKAIDEARGQRICPTAP